VGGPRAAGVGRSRPGAVPARGAASARVQSRSRRKITRIPSLRDQTLWLAAGPPGRTCPLCPWEFYSSRAAFRSARAALPGGTLLLTAPFPPRKSVGCGCRRRCRQAIRWQAAHSLTVDHTRTDPEDSAISANVAASRAGGARAVARTGCQAGGGRAGAQLRDEPAFALAEEHTDSLPRPAAVVPAWGAAREPSVRRRSRMLQQTPEAR